ncbi:ankyrin repeat-containing domain protein, partial [Pyronema domesticum]
RGADVNMQNRFGTSPLDTAVFLSTVSMVHLLIKKGAVIDSPNVYEKKTPLFYATQVWTKHNIEKTSLLLEKDADVNARDKWSRRTPLCHAIAAGAEGAMRFLLERGADINMQLSDGTSPLSIVTQMSSEHLVRLFLKERGGIMQNWVRLLLAIFFFENLRN